VTSSTVFDYDQKNPNNDSEILNDKQKDLSEEIVDPFSDLVTLAKLEKHSYKSTLNFDTNKTGDKSSSITTPPVSSDSNNHIRQFKKSSTLPTFKGDVTGGSIGERMKNLMNSDVVVEKSATGYGKYNSTPLKKSESASIPSRLSKPAPPARPPRPSALKKGDPPAKPSKPKELQAPPKPKKPNALRSEKLIEIDIEKFDKKYPNIE